MKHVTLVFITAGMLSLMACKPPQNAGSPEAPTSTSSKDTRPRIYLHIDYMVAGGHSHAPSARAIQLVVDAFERQGIVLDVDPVENAIPEAKVVTFAANPVADCVGPDAVTLDALKATYYKPRSVYEHYVVFSHYVTCPDPIACAKCPLDPVAGQALAYESGLAEQLGFSFVVSLGKYIGGGQAITDEMQAGTLMHELGHNLGLRHGGNEDVPGKPNYVSVMNYPYQFGIPTSEGTYRIDYSDRVLPALDETAGLDESQGLGDVGSDSKDMIVYTCYDPDTGLATSVRVALASGPVDWNCDGLITNYATDPDFTHGSIDPMTGKGDINGDLTAGVLRGHDDWAQVKEYLSQLAAD